MYEMFHQPANSTASEGLLAGGTCNAPEMCSYLERACIRYTSSDYSAYMDLNHELVIYLHAESAVGMFYYHRCYVASFVIVSNIAVSKIVHDRQCS